MQARIITIFSLAVLLTSVPNYVFSEEFTLIATLTVGCNDNTIDHPLCHAAPTSDPDPETPAEPKPSQSSPTRSSGGGGGGGGSNTRTNVDTNPAFAGLKLYEVSWSCDDNMTTIVTSEGDPEVTILGYDGKVTATKSYVQNLEDRTIFTAPHYEKLLSVSITSIEGRSFERISETIRADACVGDKTFTEYREKTVMQAPIPDTTPELETEPGIIPDKGLVRDPKPIPVPEPEYIQEPTPEPEMNPDPTPDDQLIPEDKLVPEPVSDQSTDIFSAIGKAIQDIADSFMKLFSWN